MSVDRRGGTKLNSGAPGPYKDGPEGIGNHGIPSDKSMEFLGSRGSASEKMAKGLKTGASIKGAGKRPVGGKRVF
jgi:hypothetical protein